jgi:hypothetical protein
MPHTEFVDTVLGRDDGGPSISVGSAAYGCVDGRLKQLSPFGGQLSKFRGKLGAVVNFGDDGNPRTCPIALGIEPEWSGVPHSQTTCSRISHRSGRSGAPRASALPMCVRVAAISGKPEIGCRGGAPGEGTF